jgi:hypothetical protein
MINVRVAAALALLLGAAGAALGVIALFAALRDDDAAEGRLVETRLAPFEGDPVYFPLDELYVSTDESGTIRALYVYPPGYFGHVRGCRVVWIGNEVVENSGHRFGPGLFVDPCGGARFGRSGEMIQGPADRGLDYFTTKPGLGGVIVDTRELHCGETYQPRPPAVQESVATPPLATTTSVRGAFGTFTPTPTVTATPTETSTPTRTATAAVSATATPDACERVSNGHD